MAFISVGIKEDARCDWLSVSKSHLRGRASSLCLCLSSSPILLLPNFSSPSRFPPPHSPPPPPPPLLLLSLPLDLSFILLLLLFL